MNASDRDYFLERAEAELDLGNEARHPDTAQAHYCRAVFFLDRADGAANDD